MRRTSSSLRFVTPRDALNNAISLGGSYGKQIAESVHTVEAVHGEFAEFLDNDGVSRWAWVSRGSVTVLE